MYLAGRVQLFENSHWIFVPQKVLSQGRHLRINAKLSTFLDFTKLLQTLKVTNPMQKGKTGLL